MADERFNCVVLDDYQSVAAQCADWSVLEGSVDVVFETRYLASKEALIARLAAADIVVANRERTLFDSEVLAALPRLKLLVTTGMGNAAIDMAAARARNIVVCGTGNAGAPTAELAWALILALARNIVPEANGIKAGAWQSSLGLGLKGRVLGLVGLGRVGTAVALVGTAFSMNVMAWSPRLNDERAAAAGVIRAESLISLFEQSDVVSLHATLNAASLGLVNADLLAAMKPHALLVNTSRAGLIDEAALISALQSNRLGGVGLDVFATEPTQADNPLFAFDRVLATPHLGYVTDQNFAAYFGDAVENIAAFLKDAPIRVLN
ncbi:D-2-hydroxyacid dehydrogenase family protein [Devosia sp. MC532]|uniref:D-2-hydroxyacid dehydrogenase family protein n=1 Tax=Devosia sp. MC532 TaxID=2799788 RepID=UPI0018F7093B|nr:D-2-hydroxyacid dehydrogenase family protein [Devosia sp. MC532]MBJ7577841.1 D-2-hydroxyacid dehydrogenase family protein [Devosia sp. MC532]